MMKNKLTLSLTLTLFLCLGTYETVFSKAGCFNSKCHDKSAFNNRVVHKPVAKKECNGCHSPHVARFKGLLQQSGSELCFSCHTDEQESFTRDVVHDPVRQGKCTACHDPHSTQRAGLIKGKLNEICFTCHNKIPRQFRFTHSPFKKGQCISCHTPHNAKTYQLLRTSGNTDDICFSCHKHQAIKNSHRNFPTEPKNCLSCHNPHGGNDKSLIRKVLHRPFKKGKKGCKECHINDKPVGTDTCLRCHKEIEKEFFKTHSHLTNRTGNNCTQCHSPHASDSTIMIKGRQDQLCKDCHNDTFIRHNDKLYIHPDVLMCNSCHDAHGSNEPAMLKGGGIDLCSGCHKEEGANTHPVGENVIDPRTGQILTCVSCHDPKGTNFKNQLKASGSEDLCKQCHKY